MTTSSALPTERPAAASGHAVTPRWWYAVAVPLGLYLLTRLLQLSLVAVLAEPGGPGLSDRLMLWDAGFFAQIAEQGYETGYSYRPDGSMKGNGLAFFPLYPALIYLVSWLPGVGTAGAALTVAGIAGAVAAVLLSRLGERLYNRRTGYALAVLFGIQPMSVVLSMGYSEALFAALVAASLLAVHRNAWLLGGGFAMLAGLTRPTGLALGAALLAAAVWWSWRARVDTPGAVGSTVRPGSAYPDWRVVTGVLVALAGTPLYLLWVGLRVGELDAWFRMQRLGWGTSWDYGLSTGRFLLRTFAEDEGWVGVSTALIIVLTGLAVVVALSERVWLPLSLYGLLAYAMAVGSSGFYHSRPRMLVPELLVLFPLAILLGRCRRRTAVLLLAGLAPLGCWYGAYMITVWPYTI